MIHDVAESCGVLLMRTQQPVDYAKTPRDCGGMANEFDLDFRRVRMISNEPTNELDRDRSYLSPLMPLACGAASLISKK